MPDNECSSCGESDLLNECPNSEKDCGHHCNHSWSHEACCWCGKSWECEDEEASDAASM